MNASTGKKSAKKTSAASSEKMDPQKQLQEIQHLLFGQQLSEVSQTIEALGKRNDKQFAEMNKNISASIKDLKVDFTEKLGELSRHVEKLNEEEQNRDALVEGDVSSLEQALDSFQKQSDAAHDALEAQLFAEVEKLAPDTNGKYKDVLDKLGEASGDLSERKTDRKTLAELLVNMANNLDSE